jgi:uncharacterized coiled-coil protein SlyX
MRWYEYLETLTVEQLEDSIAELEEIVAQGKREIAELTERLHELQRKEAGDIAKEFRRDAL